MAAPHSDVSPQFAAVLAALRRSPLSIETGEFADLRARFDAVAPPVACDVEVAQARIAGTPVELLTAPGARSDRTVVYLHGGGYVMGSPTSHRHLAGEVSRAGGARVALVDYPLAPEHPFPAAVDAVAAVCAELLDSAAPTDRIAVAGDSAGAGIAVAALLGLRARGGPLPCACACVSPYVDLDRATVAPPELVAADPIVTPAALTRTAALYLGSGTPAGDQRAAVFRADLTGLPPMLVQVGAAEVLLDDARLLAARARACAVPVELEEWPGMIHVWHLFCGRVPESTAAVTRLGAFLAATMDDA